MLGSAMALQGDFVEAERVLREALTLEGAAAYSKATLGWLLARSGRREDALGLLRELDAAREQGYVSPSRSRFCTSGWGTCRTRSTGRSVPMTNGVVGWPT